MPIALHRLVSCSLLIALAITACGSDADDTTLPPEPSPTAQVGESTPAPTPPTVDATPTPPLLEATPTPPQVEVTPTPTPPQIDPTPTPTPPQVDPGPSPTPLATSPPGLPGEPWDLFVPAPGELVAVVGVAFDDILEVHQAPGENTPLVGTLQPLATNVISAGEGRQLPNSIWWRIVDGSTDGWVGSRFMSRLGTTNDITADIVASIGERPRAETMVDLGMIVANDRSSEDPPSRVVISVAPTVGDLGEITIDVVGLGDDAVEGERLHIFGEPLENGEGFSLRSVEATVMCSRGVTADGLCL